MQNERLVAFRRSKGLTNDLVDQRRAHVDWADSAKNAGQEEIVNSEEHGMQLCRNACRKMGGVCEPKMTEPAVSLARLASEFLAGRAVSARMNDSYQCKRYSGRTVCCVER